MKKEQENDNYRFQKCSCTLSKLYALTFKAVCDNMSDNTNGKTSETFETRKMSQNEENAIEMNANITAERNGKSRR